MESDQGPAKAIAALPVVGAQFCDFQAVDLTLSSSGVFSCGKYTVRDAKQNEVFAVKGSFGCGRQRRVMDSSGKVLLVLQKQACSFQNKWMAYLDEDRLLFTAKKPCFRLKFCVDVYLGENTTPDFKLTGCGCTGKYSLHRADTGELIAKARYKWNLASLARCNTYSIEIEPGVDSVFVISVFLVMNEIYLDRPVQGGGGGGP